MNRPDAPPLDFTESALRTPRGRYGHDLEPQSGEAERRPNRRNRELTGTPIVAWSDGGSTLPVAWAGGGDFRCEFFHRAHEHDGSGFDRCDNPAERAVTLLRAQADHDRERQQEAEQAPAC